MASLFKSLNRSIENAWKLFIRPPRFDYGPQDLGPKNMVIGNQKVSREDFTVDNKRGS